MASVLLKNCTKWDEHKDNDIKQCYRANETTTFLDFLTFEGGSPSKFDKWDLETWLKKRVSFICSLTMFNTILFYACHIRQITCNFQTNGSRIDFFPTQMGSLFHIWIPLPG